MADSTSSSLDVKPKVNEIIQIKVANQEGNEVLFKIKKSTSLKKMMDAYCNAKSLSDSGAIRFMFQGARINANQTPNDLGMEDGDTIDVMNEQIGGSR